MFGQKEPTDPEELEAFLDAFFAEQMEKLHVPGAVFVLVKDGEIFFAKGYGYSDLDKKTPVIPNKTIFRMGSISKLFTATAVMQLYERGQLNLNDDVNKYLKHFQLENVYSKPITMANLLTHTSGLEQRVVGTAVRDESKLVPLGEYLASGILRPVMPPGEVIIYSSPGMALAGYLVEQISGVPFAQYIDKNISQPLDMDRSSFEQPPPSRLSSNLAIGYKYEKGIYKPYTSDYLTLIPPAGDFYSTAIDIAHFMIAHLQGCYYNDSRILNENTVKNMHQQHFTLHPRLRGRTYGFSEWFENSQRAIFHDGSAPGFNARLFLLPDKNLGFFVAWNSNTTKLHWELTSRFLDHYYPVEDESNPCQPVADVKHRAVHFSGCYQPYGFSSKTIAKLSTLFEQIRVKEGDDCSLTVGTSQYTEVDSLLFQQVDGKNCVAFREDEVGRVTHLFFGTGAYKRLSWWQTKAFQLGLFGFFVLVFLSASILNLFPVVNLQLSHVSQLTQLLVGIICALNMVFLVGLALVVFRIDKWEFVYGIPPVLIVLFFIPVMTTLLIAALTVSVALAWQSGYWSVIDRLHYLLITISALAFVPFLHYWNLLRFRHFRADNKS